MAEYPRTWVIVADSARARFFELTEPTEPLTEIADPANPRGRLKEQELSSDRPGLAMGTQGQRRGHPMQVAQSGHDKSTDAFAHQIAATLVEGLDAGKYSQLFLFAPPQFLGRLRSSLDPRVAQIVIESIPLDLTREDVHTIKSRLPKLRAAL